MADITMCKGEDCPVKNNCYRYVAKPGKYCQSYFVAAPINTDNKICDHYWKLVKESNDD